MVRILFLSANPEDTNQLKLIKECNNIYEKIRSTDFGNEFDFQQRHEVALSQLQDHLLDLRPQVVHFSGHGSSQGNLIFQNESGYAEQAPVESVAKLFKILNEDKEMLTEAIRIVVLSACYSEKQAAAIAKYVDCVVGMSIAVTDESARIFAEGFYRGLGYGKSVQQAFDLACNEVGLAGKTEDQIPKLKCRRGIDPSQVNVIKSQTIESQPHKIGWTKLGIVAGIAIAAIAVVVGLISSFPIGEQSANVQAPSQSGLPSVTNSLTITLQLRYPPLDPTSPDLRAFVSTIPPEERVIHLEYSADEQSWKAWADITTSPNGNGNMQVSEGTVTCGLAPGLLQDAPATYYARAHLYPGDPEYLESYSDKVQGTLDVRKCTKGMT